MEKFFLHKYQNDIYPVQFLVILTSNADEIRRRGIDFEGEVVYAHALFGGYKGKTSIAMVFNPWNDYKCLTHGVIAHEGLHAVNFAYDFLNIKYDTVNDEPAAYLIQWMVNKAYDTFNKRGVVIR